MMHDYPIAGIKTADLPEGEFHCWLDEFDGDATSVPLYFEQNDELVAAGVASLDKMLLHGKLDVVSVAGCAAYRLIKGRRIECLRGTYLPGTYTDELRQLEILPKNPKTKPDRRSPPRAPIARLPQTDRATRRAEATALELGVELQNVVYRLYAASGALLYVGITNRGIGRISEHERSKPWFNEVDRIEFERFALRNSAAHREADLIKRLAPLYNVTHNLGRQYLKESL